MTGPDEEVTYAVNDEMQLNWEFDGFGDQYCFIDGKLFHNMGEFYCRPPLTLQLPDRRNHSLRVIMQVGLIQQGDRITVAADLSLHVLC